MSNYYQQEFDHLSNYLETEDEQKKIFEIEKGRILKEFKKLNGNWFEVKW